MPSDAGRPLRGLGFAQATVAPVPAVRLCAARIRALGALAHAAIPFSRR